MEQQQQTVRTKLDAQGSGIKDVEDITAVVAGTANNGGFHGSALPQVAK